MWKIFFEYMDKSKITLTGKGSDISLRLAMKYNNLYNHEAVRAEYQRYPKNKYAAIPLEAKIIQLKETEELHSACTVQKVDIFNALHRC